MLIKLEKIYMSKDAFTHLNSQDLPVKLAYKLMKIIKEVNIYMDIINTKKEAIINKYVEKASNSIPEDKLVEANKELEEVLSEEVDLNITTIPLNDFPEKVEIDANKLLLIEWAIVE